MEQQEFEKLTTDILRNVLKDISRIDDRIKSISSTSIEQKKKTKAETLKILNEAEVISKRIDHNMLLDKIYALEDIIISLSGGLSESGGMPSISILDEIDKGIYMKKMRELVQKL